MNFPAVETEIPAYLYSNQKLEDTVLISISDKVNTYLKTITYDINLCKSPIERLFYVEMVSEIESKKSNSASPGCNLELSINPQVEISGNGEKFIVDFVFSVVDFNVKKTWSFIVECDGFEFHSSKEKMRKDYMRQRSLQRLGYSLIRFTGSEIYEDCYTCISSAVMIVEAHIRDYYKQHNLNYYD